MPEHAKVNSSHEAFVSAVQKLTKWQILNDWEIGADIAIRLQQKSDVEVTNAEQLEAMFNAIRNAVTPFGFSVLATGTWSNMVYMGIEEITGGSDE